MAPIIGIDFGTSNSSMAWYNPATGHPEIIRNQEGRERTPSVVYFGKELILVGKSAEEKLNDDEEYERVITSVKRDLVKPTVMSFPGRPPITPVEVAAKILRKLKHDAETGLFQEPVERVVITHPAIFDALERDKLEEAAKKAGFKKVWLLPEPEAAAKAYVHAGLKMGQHLLVYDLGGGTFDLAVLRHGEVGWDVAMKPTGARCGGDDFDRALYDYSDEMARQQLGRPISLTNQISLSVLSNCRKLKESLSQPKRESAKFNSYLRIAETGKLEHFKYKLERTEFDKRILHIVEQTVQLTKNTLNEAKRQGDPVDTVVLIGGSSRVPLVQEQLAQSLPVKPLEWEKRDVAVALGAAIHAYQITRPPIPPPPPSPSPPPPPPPPSPEELTQTIRQEFSLLRDKLDDFGKSFEEECIKNVESFINDDRKWTQKPDEINNCIIRATIAYTVKVHLNLQAVLNKLKKDSEAPDFNPKSAKIEITAAGNSGAAWGFWIATMLGFLGGPIGIPIYFVIKNYSKKYLKELSLNKVAEVASQIQPELKTQAEHYLNEAETWLLEEINRVGNPENDGGLLGFLGQIILGKVKDVLKGK